ncbi:hypothetical protein Tco_1314879 [Tanacetum coccineum]
MSTLTFVDTHNMVAFLEKLAESDGFHEIIDFLNANQIRYALTVNPTIHTSCIEQFWATAKAKTVNGERQIQALTDKKMVIIMESCIRSDLHLADVGEKAKDAQAKEIADLKKRVQKLERKKKSRTIGFKRLRKVSMSRRVESSEDKDTDDTQGRSDDAKMFDTNELHGDEVVVDIPLGEKQEQSAKEREVNTSVEDSVAPTTIEKITLAQTLIQIKAAKPKVVTTATTTTTTTTTRPKARGVIVQEPSEFRTPQES